MKELNYLTEAPARNYRFGESRTAQHLGLEPLMEDFDTEVKARTIDCYIHEQGEDELEDSDVGFKLGLEKLMQHLGMNYMEEMKRGKNLKMLDMLFSHIAMQDKMASDTFLSKVRSEIKDAKVLRLKDEIKKLQATK